MSELLSKDEVDALLTGVEDGAVAIEDGERPACDMSLTSQRLNGWQKQLGLVDDNLGRCLGQRMLGLLHKPAQVSMEGVRLLRFGEYLDSLELPTGLSSFRLEPAGGVLMIVMDAHLVYSLVESLFGGHGRQVAIHSRGFSATEQRVMGLGLDSILDAVRGAWRQLEGQTFTACESEHNPQASSVFDAGEIVMIRRYSIRYEGGGGELCLVMSDDLVEALFRTGTVARPAAGNGGKDVMRRRAREFRATVAGVVSGVEVPLKQLLKLKRGDVLPIDSPEIVDVTVNGVKKFSARVGDVDGRVGLSIVSPEEGLK
jgi:flagellar motor switch protein FliM